MKANRIRSFRPQAEALDARVVPSDVVPTGAGDPPAIQYEPSPLLTLPQADPTSTPIPLLTLPGAPDPFAPPAPAPRTGPVSAVITIEGHTYNCIGTTNGTLVGINTKGIPCELGTIRMTFPDGSTATYQGFINLTNPLKDVRYEEDPDTGAQTMYLPCNCVVPAIAPQDLGLSA